MEKRTKVEGVQFPKPERTDEDKLLQSPIVVSLGGREFEIKPLVILYARPWRKKVVALIATIPKYMKIDTSKPDEFAEAMNALMVDKQDELIDLFFEYARDLDRHEIESTATEIELSKALESLMEYAFPLSDTLPLIMGEREKPKPPQSQKG